jgi:hypothetical protein
MSLQTEQLAVLLGAVMASFSREDGVTIRDHDTEMHLVVGDLYSPDLTFTVSDQGTVFTFRTRPMDAPDDSNPNDQAMNAAMCGLHREWETRLLDQYIEDNVTRAVDFLARYAPERLSIVRGSGDPDGVDY